MIRFHPLYPYHLVPLLLTLFFFTPPLSTALSFLSSQYTPSFVRKRKKWKFAAGQKGNRHCCCHKIHYTQDISNSFESSRFLRQLYIHIYIHTYIYKCGENYSHIYPFQDFFYTHPYAVFSLQFLSYIHISSYLLFFPLFPIVHRLILHHPHHPMATLYYYNYTTSLIL